MQIRSNTRHKPIAQHIMHTILLADLRLPPENTQQSDENAHKAFVDSLTKTPQKDPKV